MSAPSPIAIGRGVRIRKRSHGGVIASRLKASAKKSKAASTGSGTSCARSMVCRPRRATQSENPGGGSSSGLAATSARTSASVRVQS